MAEQARASAEQRKEPVVIKKYANRRLYNTETSTYVTLDDLAEMVRSERDFVVYDAKSGEDLTHGVLTQIIVEQEGRGGTSLLPIPFLRQLIRFYDDSMGRLVPTYLQYSLETLTKEQERYRKQFAHLFSANAFGASPFAANPFGAAALEAMQEQARKNIAMFEKALAMFSPFPMAQQQDARQQEEGAKPAEGSSASGTTAEKPANTAEPSSPANELAELKAQLKAMQVKIDKITGEG
ncbi:MAG: polyhydroxyalkanoate synthesis repressor PhaR [Hyphomicrobiaceae bacterium]|nr:MAG: polyhydroxyalkanoate synthesis repressor PhaR [Hyphomicrobiaceae bacterium]